MIRRMFKELTYGTSRRTRLRQGKQQASLVIENKAAHFFEIVENEVSGEK